MEEIIKKLDVLSREITKFVIDNQLNYAPFSDFHNEKNELMFSVYVSKDNKNTTSFSLVRSKIELIHFRDAIDIPVGITEKELTDIYYNLLSEWTKWKDNNLEEFRKKAKEAKILERKRLELELSKLKTELNEL